MHISLTSPPLILVVMLYHSHEFCSQGILHGRAVHHRHVTLELAAEQAAIGESPRFREDDVPWLWQETHILPCPFNPFNPVVQVPRRFVPIDKVPLCQYAGRIYQFRPVMTDNITELELIFTIDNIFLRRADFPACGPFFKLIIVHSPIPHVKVCHHAPRISAVAAVDYTAHKKNPEQQLFWNFKIREVFIDKIDIEKLPVLESKTCILSLFDVYSTSLCGF